MPQLRCGVSGERGEVTLPGMRWSRRTAHHLMTTHEHIARMRQKQHHFLSYNSPAEAMRDLPKALDALEIAVKTVEHYSGWGHLHCDVCHKPNSKAADEALAAINERLNRKP